MANNALPASFLALGDSFTEGLNDLRDDGTMRGWADRFALLLDEARPGIRYGNLAIRGRVLQQILDEQLPIALAEHPDLVGFSAGGNDILRVGSDPDEVAARYENGVRELRAAGSRVLVFTGFDVGVTPVLRLARGKIAIYNEHLRVIASRNDCDLVDLWSLDTLRDRRSFSEDRLHLSAEGHERVARLVAHVVGVPAGDPEEPYTTMQSAGSRRADLHWAREHLLPWVGRRVRHQSSGDDVPVKRPELSELRPPLG
ncbi:SGNH/GDSL hydrolase family protein [uncultured Jatrophihabitans sp.]|uniref:SGNH/GDSL hydrolase family protein n=1 Tax=uncultured Jatrophihabitans sp. TaxID=1610747 RepID=UPI0035CC1DB3